MEVLVDLDVVKCRSRKRKHQQQQHHQRQHISSSRSAPSNNSNLCFVFCVCMHAILQHICISETFTAAAAATSGCRTKHEHSCVQSYRQTSRRNRTNPPPSPLLTVCAVAAGIYRFGLHCFRQRTTERIRHYQSVLCSVRARASRPHKSRRRIR